VISVLLTTENSDDLEIRVLHGSRSSKVTPVNSSCVIPISDSLYPRPLTGPKSLYLLPLLRLTSPTEGFPWDDIRKILHESQRMAKVHSDEEMLPKSSTP